MPPVVSFYLLNQQYDAALFTCRLAQKALAQHYTMYIHTASEAESQQLDQQLWHWQEDSFLPHGLVSDTTLPQNTPVLIGTTPPPPPTPTPTRMNHLLINLHSQVPAFHTQFQRICEIVPQNEAGKALSRQKYRYYQSLGITPEVHHIG